MFRYLVIPVLMALLLVPDWAEAIGRRNPIIARRAQPVAYSYPVQYSQPVYYATPPVQVYPASGCSPCCQTMTAAPAPKPTVIPERMEPAPVKPKSNVQSEPLAQPKAVEPEPSFKPAVATETLPAMKDPVPVVPVAKPKDADTIPLIPVEKPKEEALPALPPLKFGSDPKKEELPKLELPKFDVPAIPPLIEPDPVPKQSTVRSSPLGESKLKIDRYPIEGTSPASSDSLRAVTFYNFSGRELTLTLDGKDVTVPSKHSVEAKLPTAFAWKLGGEAQVEGTIPPTAPGMDIVIGK